LERGVLAIGFQVERQTHEAGVVKHDERPKICCLFNNDTITTYASRGIIDLSDLAIIMYVPIPSNHIMSSAIRSRLRRVSTRIQTRSSCRDYRPASRVRTRAPQVRLALSGTQRRCHLSPELFGWLRSHKAFRFVVLVVFEE